VPASGDLVIEVEHLSAINLGMAAYSASSCTGPFTPIGCNADAVPNVILEPRISINSPELAGTTLYIRVWPEIDPYLGGTFTICARATTPPLNDHVCNALPLVISEPCSPDTHSVLYSTIEANIIYSPDAPACSSPFGSGDVWFTLPAPAGGNLTLLAGSEVEMDLAMAVYTFDGTDCASGTYSQVGCAAAGLDPLTLRVDLFDLIEGTDLFIRVWNNDPTNGEFTICASLPDPSVNDDPCGAIELALQYGCLPAVYSIFGATTTSVDPLGTINIPLPSCGIPSADIWFTVIVPPSGSVGFDTDDLQLTDAAMTVYRRTSGDCATNDLILEEVPGSCVLNGSSNAPEMPFAVVNDLTPGERIWLRFWSETGGNGVFALCADRMDEIIGIPGITCYYAVSMSDTGQDGWNGAALRICVGGVCTEYTCAAGGASFDIPIDQAQLVTVVYQPGGNTNAQNSYQINGWFGGLIVANSFTFPSYAGLGDCNAPPATSNDCAQAYARVHPSLGEPVYTAETANGLVQELNDLNRGCLELGEQGSTWIRFTCISSGPFAYSINPIGTQNTDLDFALWGPLDGNICPPTTLPIRCSFAQGTGPTGMDLIETDQSEDETGNGWVAQVNALAGETYLLLVTGHDLGAAPFTLQPIFPTSLDQPISSEGTRLRIVPNPVGNEQASLLIKTTGPMDLVISLKDASGRLVSVQRLKGVQGEVSYPLELSALEAGSYLVEVTDLFGRLIGQTRTMILGR